MVGAVLGDHVGDLPAHTPHQKPDLTLINAVRRKGLPHRIQLPKNRTQGLLQQSVESGWREAWQSSGIDAAVAL